MKDHIDLWLVGSGGRRWSVDVKAAKSLKRGHPVQDRYVWLEDRNVRGDEGWLHGRAEFIAFGQLDGSLAVICTN